MDKIVAIASAANNVSSLPPVSMSDTIWMGVTWLLLILIPFSFLSCIIFGIIYLFKNDAENRSKNKKR